MKLDGELRKLVDEAETRIQQTMSPGEVEAVRVAFLGQQGRLKAYLKGIGSVAPEERKTRGAAANVAKQHIESLLEAQKRLAEERALDAELSGEKIDVTLPGRMRRPGRRHPVSQTMDDVVRTFQRLGFEVIEGPEIELDYFNFEALGLPKDHPARDMQDTFYIEANWLKAGAQSPVLLRTHTSPVQVRTMKTRKPPIRAVMPGKVYRCDSDLTHTPMFHQIEGLLVDKRVSLAELKGTLSAFARGMFGTSTKTRFRASYFPFTEPSAEMDITCLVCGGQGCRVCKQSGWLEILGSGLVHPNVFAASGYDSSQVTGFAFGMGIERIAMLRHRIDDLRRMFENDARFLEQFS
ncbi:MAG: phenylalanine--tRNA ligase subunit alpha [Myxococcaceae bacterium]